MSRAILVAGLCIVSVLTAQPVPDSAAWRARMTAAGKAPDPLAAYRELVPLAEKFGKPGEAAEYGRLLKELTPKA